jgi:hypothetical protein
MIKASSLYIVIIVALVIAVICSSLIVAAYYYNEQYQKKFRFDRMQNNVLSGVNLLGAFSEEQKYSLFNNDIDSVNIKTMMWGMFDVGMVQAFINQDTLSSAFSYANQIDSSRWASLYLIDEDRPLSVSGKTIIKGDVYLPKAGVRSAYVNNTAYEGDEKIISGHQYASSKQLPPLNLKKIEVLDQMFTKNNGADHHPIKEDSIHNSFFFPVRMVHFQKDLSTLSRIKLSGHLVIFSDTLLTIENTAQLENILVFARSIRVKSGFRGNCQLFARDSITVEQDCRFTYPSCLALLKSADKTVSLPAGISIGEKTIFDGIIFAYEKEPGKLKAIIRIDKNAVINGEVYSPGIVLLKDDVTINGSIVTNRFLYQSSYTAYENYLINTRIDSHKLSPYYLTSPVMSSSNKKRKVLQWLETK